jgi:hypothetical protein
VPAPLATAQLRRVVGRTILRRLRRVELWNGNLEPPLRTVFADRNHIVRWAVRTRGEFPGRIRRALAENPGLRLVTIRSDRDARRLLAALDRA